MQTIDKTILEEITVQDLLDADLEKKSPSANMLTENGLELRELGFRDISEADQLQAEIISEAMKSIQVQRTLEDLKRGSSYKRSTYDYLEQHADFLVNISPGKTKKEIISHMTIEHAASIMKITAKADVPEKLLKKHLSHLKKKYD